MTILKKGKFDEQGPIELDAKKIEEILREKRKKEKLESYEGAPPEIFEEDIDKTIEDNIELVKEVEEKVIKSKTEKILKDAEEKVREMKEKAQVEIESQKKASREEGFNAGKEEGQNSVAEKMKEALGLINGAVKEKNKIISEAKSEILKLSLKIAEQIIRSEISLNQGICMNIVTEAIGKITDRDNVIIKVNRVDLDYVKKNRDRLLEIIDGVKNLNIHEDTSVEPGGCIVETDLGYVDGRISTKLESISLALDRTYEDEKIKQAESLPKTSEKEEESKEENGGMSFLDNI